MAKKSFVIPAFRGIIPYVPHGAAVEADGGKSPPHQIRKMTDVKMPMPHPSVMRYADKRRKPTESFEHEKIIKHLTFACFTFLYHFFRLVSKPNSQRVR